MMSQILNNSSNLFSSRAAQVIQKVVTGQRRVQYLSKDFMQVKERLNGIQWSWVQIPLGPTFYSCFK